MVVFAFDGFNQPDMDSFATLFEVPPITVEVMGPMPEQRSGEATMDLQMIHAVAPDAKLVLVNSRPTVEGDGGFEKLARLMESVDREHPRRDLELLHRLGMRPALHRRRSRAGARRADQGVAQRHDGVRRIRRSGRTGVPRRPQLVGSAESRRRGCGRGGLDSGDDLRRRHPAVHRRRRAGGSPSSPGTTSRSPRAAPGEYPVSTRGHRGRSSTRPPGRRSVVWFPMWRRSPIRSPE